MKKIFILFILLLPFQIFTQSLSDVYEEANPVYKEVQDNSAFAKLWSNLIKLRKTGDEANYVQASLQIESDFPEKFVRVPLNESRNEFIPVTSFSNDAVNLPDAATWTDEFLIYNGNIGISSGGNPTTFKKMIKSVADTLGNLYVALTTNWYDSDTLKFYKSTDKGFTWLNIQNIFAGSGRRYQGFDIAVTDTVGGWKIGMVVSIMLKSSLYVGSIYYADMNDDGTGFTPSTIQSATENKGYVSPTIATDGFSWSPGSTFWYVAYQEVDTTSGVGSAVIAAATLNGGYSWILDTARVGWNDYELDIDYNFKADSIYVLLTNNLNPTDENLRIRYISLGVFGTSATWKQYNPASTTNPEFDGTLAVNRGDSSMAVIYTTSVAGNRNIQYSYTSNGVLPMVTNVDIAATTKTEERASIHSPETQKSAYRIAYISKAASYDTLLYSGTLNIASGFPSPTLVNRVNEATAELSSSVLGFRSSTSGHSGGVFFAGFGPTNLYFNSSNLVSDVRDLPGTVEKYSLAQNYPNPFNPSTKIRFSVPEQTNLTLKIYNTIGQEVASLFNGEIAAGNHEVNFDASNLSSGIYFYRIQSPSFNSTKKMILIK